MTKETFNLDLDGFERYASVQTILVAIKATANKRFHFKRYGTYLYKMETELIKTTEVWIRQSILANFVHT